MPDKRVCQVLACPRWLQANLASRFPLIASKARTQAMKRRNNAGRFAGQTATSTVSSAKSLVSRLSYATIEISRAVVIVLVVENVTDCEAVS